MELTGVGVLCLAACVLIMARPLQEGIVVFGAFLPLQTAAAFVLPEYGGLSIGCSHVLIGAILAAIAMRPNMAKGLLQSGSKAPEVILFALFTAYAVSSAFFMPRFFEGGVNVYSFAREAAGSGGGLRLSTLEPSAGNISQAMYAIGNFIIFWVLVYLLALGDGFRRSIALVNTATIVHLVFALISALPDSGATQAILSFVRTAIYVYHPGNEIAGLTRIIGSYSEASSFGGMSVAFFAFNFIRYIQTKGIWYSLASMALLACCFGSLSTSAYAALGLLFAARSFQTSFSLLRSGLKQEDLMLLIVNALAIGAAIVFLFNEPARVLATTLYEQLFGNKLSTASGMERGAWNAQSFSNMIETFGAGVGLGSARSSGVATAYLGNLGIVGTALFAAFLYVAILPPAAYRRIASVGRERILSIRLYSASRGAAIGVLIGALIAGTSVNLSLPFYVFAAAACASLRPIPMRQHGKRLNVVGASNLGGGLALPRKSVGRI